MESKDLYQGDMILSPEQRKSLDVGKNPLGSIKERLWPRTIPYSFSDTLSRNRKAKRAIDLAFKEFEKYACLKFVRRTTEKSYIYFYSGRGCSSPVGKTGSKNRVSLSSGCWSSATVLHEVSHSLGM